MDWARHLALNPVGIMKQMIRNKGHYRTIHTLYSVLLNAGWNLVKKVAVTP